MNYVKTMLLERIKHKQKIIFFSTKVDCINNYKKNCQSLLFLNSKFYRNTFGYIKKHFSQWLTYKTTPMY